MSMRKGGVKKKRNSEFTQGKAKYKNELFALLQAAARDVQLLLQLLVDRDRFLMHRKIPRRSKLVMNRRSKQIRNLQRNHCA